MYAYPNPWDVRKYSKHQITFANLADGVTVKIFTISGFLVKSVSSASGNAVWDLTNDSGKMVASGLYLYVASNDKNSVAGKIAIIK